MNNDKHLPPEPPSYGFVSAPPSEYPPQQQGYPPQHGYPPQPGYPPQQPGYYPPQGYPAAPAYPPQAYAPPQPPLQPQPAPIMVVPAGGWYSRNQRNKPQSNAVGAAGLIFLSGGMNIAWSSGFRGAVFYSMTKHIRVAWFIGGIIGAVLSAILSNKVPKKLVVIFSAILVTIGGILMAVTNTNSDTVTASLYLDGIANGLVFAPFMALAGELAVFYMRGLNAASMEQLCLITGFFVQAIYTSSWNSGGYYYYNTFTSENMKGVLSGIYGFLALVFGALLCIESPVITLANGDEQKAVDILRRLQRPYTVTNETYEQLAEHKRYLAQNKDLGVCQSIGQAVPAFVRLVYLRALNAFSLSAFMTYTIILASLLTGMSNMAWFIIYATCRWLGTFIATFCMESVGRKKLILFGLIICGGMDAGIASQSNIWDRLSGISTLICIFQFFAGIALTATSPYLTEAYPLGVKQHCIAFTFVVEMIVYIIIGVCDFSLSGQRIFFGCVAGFNFLGFLLGIFCLPETKRTTLREAQDKFKGFGSKGFN